MSNKLPDITAAPVAGQKISHEGKEYMTVKEGLAYILIPADASTTPQTTPQGDNQAQSVFYNPIQQFNRDLSVLAIKAYGEQVVERKKAQAERNQKKLKDKIREKKRKREHVAVEGDVSRKASKIDNGAGTAVMDIHDNAANSELKDHISDADVQARAEGDSHGVDHKDPPAETQAISAEATDPEQKSESSTRQPSFTILDALSATGLRALRYVHEIPFTTSVTANDLLPAATKTININVAHNKLEGKIKSVTGNAMTHMYNLAGDSGRDEKGRNTPTAKYDVIDLDPYGTAAPFLDAAVQSVRDDGGLLCVTCTDAGVWASNGYPEKAYSLYGGIPIKGLHSHEGGLRLILHAIATSAAKYGLAMEPLLSLSIDFYARVFVRIYKSAADVKFLAGKTMVLYNCDVGCGAWTTQMVARNKLAPNKSGKGHFWKHVFEAAPAASTNCSHCGMKTHMAGPMYAGPIHSPEFIRRILNGLPKVSKDTYQTTDRIEGMLNVALDETLPPEENLDSPTATSKTKRYDPAMTDPYPFFFIPSALSKVIHCVTPHENALRGAIRHLGYRVTRSHTKPGSIKTDAPWGVIWDIMREWVKQKAPIKDGAIRKGTAGWNIMRLDEQPKKEPIGDAPKGEEEANEAAKHSNIVFDETLGKETNTRRLVRYQVNPRENWGPMNRANGHG
ncbi:N2,N2-dimethylguanosine tRNA methyltransferase-like protein [Bisporella sp. PMI_857]|nr:N2,N2-dimethylguanosine tRNA methyltransferase-like protein [Bisporella sp. PMI_857]